MITANAQKTSEKPTLAASSKNVKKDISVKTEKAPSLEAAQKISPVIETEKENTKPEKENLPTVPKLGTMDKKEKKQN